jgi:hypothetical protein
MGQGQRGVDAAALVFLSMFKQCLVEMKNAILVCLSLVSQRG